MEKGWLLLCSAVSSVLSPCDVQSATYDDVVIASSAGPTPSFSIDPPAVNSLGQTVVDDDRQLVLADVQGSTILLKKNDEVAGGTIFDICCLDSDINDTSQVAFYADIDFPSGPCDEAFMRTVVGGAEGIALGHDELCDYDSSGEIPPAINESGSVAYAPFVFDAAGDIGTVFVDSAALAAIRRRARFRSMPRLRRLFAPFLVAVLAPWCVHAGSYHMTVIASTDGGPLHGGPFAEILSFKAPAIDSDGTVAFVARAVSQANRALFTGSQADLSIDGYSQLTGLQGQETVAISSIGSFDGGNVAFSGADAQGDAVFRSAHGALSTLYRPVIASLLDTPAVNDTGALVVLDDSPLAVLRVDSQGTTTLFQRGDTLAEGNKITGIFGFPLPDIAENGQVAFFAVTDSATCDEAVMRGSALEVAEEVALNSFADPSCALSEVGSSTGFAINEAGSIGYGAQYFDGVDSVEAAYVGLTKIWDSHTPGFPANPIAETVALNDGGGFALLIAGSDHSGVYSGGDPVADKILAGGDSLCGSTVLNVDFQRFGLNDAGQIAFWADLQDGRSLIVRAEPGGSGVLCVSEPSTELAAGASALALTGLRRRAGRTARRCPRAT